MDCGEVRGGKGFVDGDTDNTEEGKAVGGGFGGGGECGELLDEGGKRGEGEDCRGNCGKDGGEEGCAASNLGGAVGGERAEGGGYDIRGLEDEITGSVGDEEVEGVFNN